MGAARGLRGAGGVRPGRVAATHGSVPFRSHPSDEKEFSFPRNISAGSLGSLLVHHHSTNHVGEGGEPAVTEPLIAGHGAEHDARVDVEREVSGPPSSPLLPPTATPHPGSADPVPAA